MLTEANMLLLRVHCKATHVRKGLFGIIRTFYAESGPDPDLIGQKGPDPDLGPEIWTLLATLQNPK